MSELQPFLAALGGTAVEYFETLAIAYAIVRAGYPREAISAIVIGHAAVFAAAFFMSPLVALMPLFWLRLLAALMLMAMGLHWTQKSLRRLWAGRRPRWAEDPLGKLQVVAADQGAPLAFSAFVFLVMLKSSVVEAAEILLVAFPAAGASGAWAPVLWGVGLGIVGVTLLALALHGQLKKVSEVKLKLGTGLLLTALGAYWLVELAVERGLFDSLGS